MGSIPGRGTLCLYMYIDLCIYDRKQTDLKWIKDINVRHETTKLLEENISTTPFDINCSNSLLNLSSKAKEIKAKINKWNLIKLTSF